MPGLEHPKRTQGNTEVVRGVGLFFGVAQRSTDFVRLCQRVDCFPGIHWVSVSGGELHIGASEVE